MTFYRKKNKEYAYVLVCIDVLTRFLITRPLRALRGVDVKKAFEDIFKFNEEPRTIRSDRGSEFVNSTMKSYFESKNIKHILTNTEIKSSLAERVIQTIRKRIARIIKADQDFDWVTSLQQVTESYNRSKHRSLGISPLEAMCVTDVNELFHWQYKRNDKATTTGPNSPYKFDLGDRVKTSYLGSTFQRHYDEQWSPMLYTITDRKISQGYQMYKIKNWGNEEIEGWFYVHELQKVAVDENTTYEVERILKRLTVGPKNNRHGEVLVDWLGYGPKYRSWIRESDVVELEKP